MKQLNKISTSFLKKHPYISISLISLLLLIFWITWGNIFIETTSITIEDERIPGKFDGFKIAQVSDLHNKDWKSQLIDQLQVEQPDIIVITGDLVDSSNTNLPIALEFIDKASIIAPIYYVTGNHESRISEYDELVDELLNRQVTILDNDKTILTSGADELLLFGLQDPAFPGTEIDKTIQELTTDFEGYSILLSHRPELFETYVEEDIDLVFSGHAHGGQFRVPFIGGLVAPNQGLFPEYTSGLYTENHTRMIVSRGLGNSIIPVRINNQPELIVVTLKNSH